MRSQRWASSLDNGGQVELVVTSEHLSLEDYLDMIETLRLVMARFGRQAHALRGDNDRLRCYDCGAPYDLFPLDCMLPDEDWTAISPRGDDGGILCASCMVRRVSYRIPDVTVVRMNLDRAGRGGGAAEDQLRRVVVGSLRATIDAHGPITKELIGSAAKRISRSLTNTQRDSVNYGLELAAQWIEEHPEASTAERIRMLKTAPVTAEMVEWGKRELEREDKSGPIGESTSGREGPRGTP